MDTKKYEVFEKCVELASLTHAAEALGITQPGVSHVLAILENELGLTLLRRTRTGARLTPEGEQLLPFVREVLARERALEQKAAELRGLTAGEVRIGTFTSVGTHWLPGMMKEFRAQYPNILFRLFNGDYHDVETWLTDGTIDLGFTTLPSESECECIPLCEDRLLAVLPKGHPLAAAESCRVEDVVREPFISLLETSNHDVRRALSRTGLKPDVRFETKDDYAIIAMVEQGLGVSVMPELLLRGHAEGVEARPLEPGASRTIALALPAGDKTGPAARKFAQFAVEWVKRRG